MTRIGRKHAGPGSSNPWQSTLDHAAGAEPTQAGDVEPGEEEGRGGGEIGRDTETGSGGYGGDAVEAGYEEALGQPERPFDAESHGDPRTHEGTEYPDDAKRVDPDQGPIGREAREEEEDEDDTSR